MRERAASLKRRVRKVTKRRKKRKWLRKLLLLPVTFLLGGLGGRQKANPRKTRR